MCTFVVPLWLLGWLAGSAVQREADRARTEREGQALTFLRSAARKIEEHFSELLPRASQKAASYLATMGPATATRRLREEGGFPEILDILLLDEQGQLVFPVPAPMDEDLPLHGLPRGDPAISSALSTADLWTSLGKYEAAAALCSEVIERLEGSPARRPHGFSEYLLRATFLRATILKRLGLPDAAKDFKRAREIIAGRTREWANDSEKQALDLLAQEELVALSKDRKAGLDLMRAIADGAHDLISDGLLAAVQQRLLDGFPEDCPEHAAAHACWLDDQARQHARTFAADYQDLLRQQVARRLIASDGGPIHQLFTLGGTGSLLWVRPLADGEKERHSGCSLACLRFDLSLLLEVTESLRAAAASPFLLEVLDADGVPLLASPLRGPPDWDAPTVYCYGMQLRAIPADLPAYIEAARAAARTKALLLAGALVAAAAGAFWLWRSVSREAELAAMKVDLVSRVSHELKTPLALIRMYGETIGMGRAKDPEQAARFGGIITREADRLSAMIQRLLDFSRQQAGELTYTPVETNVTALLEKLAETHAPRLEARGSRLVRRLDPGVTVVADPQALEAAVLNLLENAAKYGTDDHRDPEIELHLVDRGSEAAIEVLDRGRGVPEEERERVFEIFHRASNAGEVRGAGLGLSLVRHFAEAHGGKATCAPRDGGGSIFTIILPATERPS
ncbi:MAG: hypothetical protein Fur0037_04950 [Planctomycetota bacterium]